MLHAKPHTCCSLAAIAIIALAQASLAGTSTQTCAQSLALPDLGEIGRAHV